MMKISVVMLRRGVITVRMYEDGENDDDNVEGANIVDNNADNNGS